MPEAFDRTVYSIVRAIPPGRVMTYGSIAALLPPPPGVEVHAYLRIRARWVGYAMGRAPEGLPWHRVVAAHGRISPRRDGSMEVQRALLKREGIRFEASGRVPMDRFAWSPGEAWMRRHGLRPSPPTRPRSSRRHLGG